MLSIVGSIIVLASVLGSFMMEGGSVLLLWHPSEFIIILGAALGAFITSNPLKVVKHSCVRHWSAQGAPLWALGLSGSAQAAL